MKKVLLPMLAAAAFMTACDSDGQDVDVSYAPGTPGDFQRNIKDRVFFGFDKATVSADAKKTLESQSAWLKTHSATTASLESHADERGTKEYNQALSARRGESVKSSLSSMGIEASRLKVVAYGKDKPIVPNAKTEKEHVQNRVVVTAIN